jgi:hypothetical protein
MLCRDNSYSRVSYYEDDNVIYTMIQAKQMYISYTNPIITLSDFCSQLLGYHFDFLRDLIDHETSTRIRPSENRGKFELQVIGDICWRNRYGSILIEDDARLNWILEEIRNGSQVGNLHYNVKITKVPRQEYDMEAVTSSSCTPDCSRQGMTLRC